MTTNAIQRISVPMEHVPAAIEVLHKEVLRRISRKGDGSYAGRHEILGILEEEHHELKEAVWKGSLANIRAELLDYAVGVVWAVACIDSGILSEDST